MLFFVCKGLTGNGTTSHIDQIVHFQQPSNNLRPASASTDKVRLAHKNVLLGDQFWKLGNNVLKQDYVFKVYEMANLNNKAY